MQKGTLCTEKPWKIVKKNFGKRSMLYGDMSNVGPSGAFGPLKGSDHTDFYNIPGEAEKVPTFENS